MAALAWRVRSEGYQNFYGGNDLEMGSATKKGRRSAVPFLMGCRPELVSLNRGLLGSRNRRSDITQPARCAVNEKARKNNDGSE